MNGLSRAMHCHWDVSRVANPIPTTTPIVATNFCATHYLSLEGVDMSWSNLTQPNVTG